MIKDHHRSKISRSDQKEPAQVKNNQLKSKRTSSDRKEPSHIKKKKTAQIAQNHYR